MTSNNTGRHVFPFKGGEHLTTIGASFFVSYLYHMHVDPTHKNWTSIKTQNSRISTINRTEEFHHFWLNCIASMKDANLSRNTIGIKGVVIKEMALKILKSKQFDGQKYA